MAGAPMTAPIKGKKTVKCSNKCGEDFHVEIHESDHYQPVRYPCNCGGQITVSTDEQAQFINEMKKERRPSIEQKGKVEQEKPGNQEASPGEKPPNARDEIVKRLKQLIDRKNRETFKRWASSDQQFSTLLQELRSILNTELAPPGEKKDPVQGGGVTGTSKGEVEAPVSEPVEPLSAVKQDDGVNPSLAEISKWLGTVESSVKQFLGDHQMHFSALKKYVEDALAQNQARRTGSVETNEPVKEVVDKEVKGGDVQASAWFFGKLRWPVKSQDRKVVSPHEARKPPSSKASTSEDLEFDANAILEALAEPATIRSNPGPISEKYPSARREDFERIVEDLPDLLDALVKPLDHWEVGTPSADENGARAIVLKVLRKIKMETDHWKSIHQYKSFPDPWDDRCLFDPDSHDPRWVEPTGEPDKHGTIKHTIYLGYRWKGQRLRMASVVVWGPLSRDDAKRTADVSRAVETVEPKPVANGHATSPGIGAQAIPEACPAEVSGSPESVSLSGLVSQATTVATAADEPVEHAPLDKSVRENVLTAEPTTPAPANGLVGEDPSQA
jgi:hypothetical protein